jgi:hypothetical protein
VHLAFTCHRPRLPFNWRNIAIALRIPRQVSTVVTVNTDSPRRTWIPERSTYERTLTAFRINKY